MLTHRSFKTRLLVCFAACGMYLTTTSTTLAWDCGCTKCAPAHPGCTCNCEKEDDGHCCLYKALDMFAGGIEKALHLREKKRRSKSNCDDGCCSCGHSSHEAMMSPPVMHLPEHMHFDPSANALGAIALAADAQPVARDPTSAAFARRSDSEPSLDADGAEPMATGAAMTEPRMDLQMSEPRMESTPRGGQVLGGEPIQPNTGTVPPPVRLPEPDAMPNTMPEPDPETDGGSLFDSLDNPFGDDEVRVEPYRSIRPSHYETDEIHMRPIRKRPLSHSYLESKRRTRKSL